MVAHGSIVPRCGRPDLVSPFHTTVCGRRRAIRRERDRRVEGIALRFVYDAIHSRGAAGRLWRAGISRRSSRSDAESWRSFSLADRDLCRCGDLRLEVEKILMGRVFFPTYRANIIGVRDVGPYRQLGGMDGIDGMDGSIVIPRAPAEPYPRPANNPTQRMLGSRASR